jgi:hypothetical protein
MQCQFQHQILIGALVRKISTSNRTKHVKKERNKKEKKEENEANEASNKRKKTTRRMKLSRVSLRKRHRFGPRAG